MMEDVQNLGSIENNRQIFDAKFYFPSPCGRGLRGGECN
jgi:hypothetical protein